MFPVFALVAALLAPAHGPNDWSHIRPAGSPDAVYTTGQPGSPVRFGRLRAGNLGEDWAPDGYANPYGAAAFFWDPGGQQTNDYLQVTTVGASLVLGAQYGTVFVPLAQSGAAVVLGTLVNGYPSAAEVLTDAGGRLVLAPEGPSGPVAGQWWTVGP